MYFVEVKENEIFPLEDKYLLKVKEIKLNNPNLPFSIVDKKLVFDNYIVGIFQFEDLNISILPRNSAFNLKSFFEMLTFVNTDYFLPTIESSGFDLAKSIFNLENITHYFCVLCNKLLQYGITGQFIDRIEYSKFVKGKINFTNFTKKNLVVKGLKIQSQEFLINTLPNMIIKTALLKLYKIENNRENISSLSMILRDFDEVRELNAINGIPEHLSDIYFSANPYYPIVMEYAIKILKDFKISYEKGVLSWYSFLENSNTIFEHYIRKVLNQGLTEKVEKWEKGKQFASLKYMDKEDSKYFSPDVIIDYNENDGTCLAICDVKNKEFNPKEGKLNECVSNNDLYQIIFYCNKLRSKIGCLIYPGVDIKEPVILELEHENDLRLFLLSIDMNTPIIERNNYLIKIIKEKVLVYT